MPAAKAQQFRSDAQLVFGVLSRLRSRASIPASSITAVLADDLAGEVDRLTSSPKSAPFDARRVGGEVAGKNLPQAPDSSSVVIVFAAKHWMQGGDSRARLSNLFLLAHELAHPILNRASHASGAMDGVLLPSVTPHEHARSGARIQAEEYQADRLADTLIGSLGEALVDGVARPSNIWWLRGDDYRSALADAIHSAHPAWPDTVESYRMGAIPLDEMWRTIAMSVDQTMTAYVHAQAAADAAGTGIDLLEDPALAHLPAVDLYLREPMAPFLEALRRGPPIMGMHRVAQVQASYTELGSAAYLEIWRRLGITPRALPRPDVYLDVEDPVR